MDKGMVKTIAKAETLIEALPYIQKFNNKIVIVKYGGSAMLDPGLQMNVIKDVALLKLVGMKPIIVHGGGKEITKWVGLLGHEARFIEGLRVTDEVTMEVAEMVLGRVNKNLVQLLQQLGVKAAGICGKDGNTLVVEKKLASGQDIGFVGNVTKVDTDLINTLLANDFIRDIECLCGHGLDLERTIITPTISMRMMLRVRLQGQLEQKSWRSLPISKEFTATRRIKNP